MKKYVFSLNLKYLQNIRFMCALLEKDKSILVPEDFKETMKFLNKYFEYDVTFADENSEKADFLEFDHKVPFVKYKTLVKPLLFPKKLILYCQNRKQTCGGKIYDCTFSGIKTPKRVKALSKWLKSNSRRETNLQDEDFYRFENSFIKFCDNGRMLPQKAFDEEYYENLLHSKFVLCPNGDFVWTYRFFEAVICGAIPIIEDYSEIYKDFFFFTMKTPKNLLKYKKEFAEHNYKILNERFTL